MNPEDLDNPIAVTREQRYELDEIFEALWYLHDKDPRDVSHVDWQDLMMKAYHLGRRHGK